MTTILISIGDELALGQTVDTNAAWLASQCAAVGLRPAAHITVPDAQAAIEDALRDAVPRCDVILVTGGLGPTEDDLTRDALAAVMGVKLELSAGALENVRQLWARLNRVMPERNQVQAMIPRGADWIENTAGTAPGLRARLRHPGHARAAAPSMTDVFVMPGVPKEMKIMFERSVLPALLERQREAHERGKDAGASVIRSRTLHTFGMGESAVADLLKPHGLMDRTRNPSVGTTVSGGVVSLRINAYCETVEAAVESIADTEALCRHALGDLIYGTEDQTLHAVVARLLIERARTVTTAESCTGGLLAKYLTDTAGSSAYFRQGWVTYSNAAKTALLGVPEAVLAEHGAVSEATVTAMAEGAARAASADYALAISGIAGPDGGTPDKPVGTVCLALHDAAAGSTTARTFTLPGDREMIRDRSAKMALTMLRFALLGIPMPV